MTEISQLLTFGSTGWGDELFFGAQITFAIAVLSYVIGIVLGLLGALMKVSKSRSAYYLAHSYSVVFRGVPELLIISILYFGGSLAIAAMLRPVGFTGYIDFSPFVSGTVALSLVTAAYAIEVFRGGILAVPIGQTDAASALGLKRPRAFLLVVLPQALRIALPGLTNLWLTILKNTSFVSVIGVVDLLRAAYLGAAATRSPLPFFLAVLIGYALMTWFSMLGINMIEGWTRRGYGARAPDLGKARNA
ncbi:His/Glu/Gln/Arg/opine family amino acid ABC transporter permease subunit [Rhodoligotrophos appendicifer]|uniref:ABC transporter permease n=1 Tax=Rhodoligotrophos appendicifer TaxID=987056 RepID=UPI00147934B8|nr:ABC transporter permease subunit [Rhodoligotrophos appendicifer]